jgi:hypothetical protein
MPSSLQPSQQDEELKAQISAGLAHVQALKDEVQRMDMQLRHLESQIHSKKQMPLFPSGRSPEENAKRSQEVQELNALTTQMNDLSRQRDDKEAEYIRERERVNKLMRNQF